MGDTPGDHAENTATARSIRDGDRPRRYGRWRLWPVLLAGALLVCCLACSLLLLLVDQAAVLSTMYVNAVSSGNSGLAELLGDHYTSESDGHQALYRMDIQRDLSWLSGKEVSDISVSHEQTLSGQPATMVRFKWRDRGSNSAWRQATLRLKTDQWLFITYIRAVEQP